MNNIKRLVFVCFAVGVVAVTRVAADELCPAVNCDCDSLRDEAWQKSCKMHETVVKQACAANGNVPLAFCSVHGPSASPLPLAVSSASFELLTKKEIGSSYSETKDIYDDLASNLQELKVKVSTLALKESIALTKSLSASTDTLHTKQNQVAVSWQGVGSDRKAVAVWREFAKHSEDIASAEFAYGTEVWTKYQTASPQLKKAYKIIAFKVLRLAGKSYEMAATAWGNGDKNKEAARTWVQGAEVAKLVLAGKKESGAKQAYIDFYQAQVAARLYRAGYYWDQDGNEEEALTVLIDAQKVYPEVEVGALIAVKSANESGEPLQLVQ